MFKSCSVAIIIRAMPFVLIVATRSLGSDDAAQTGLWFRIVTSPSENQPDPAQNYLEIGRAVFPDRHMVGWRQRNSL